QVENIAKPMLGETGAAALTAGRIEEFLGQVAPADARRVLASLNSILAEAARRGHIKANPARGVKAALEKPAAKPPSAPTTDDLRMLLPAAGDALAVRMATALLTGLRVNELRALTWDNIDLDGAVINVRRTTGGGGALVRARPNAARRSLPITPALVAILREWMAAGPDLGLNLVFPGKHGGVIGAGLMQRGGFARLQKKLGITGADGKAKYRFGDLRHAAARLLIEQGWPARKLRDHLGEASMATITRRYGDIYARAGDDRTALTLIAERLLRTVSGS
ncbi:MAG: site-specific integrase, partial [Proteobacteria bacterium]|nr:site-specific integrase [Pseudomonadota bacterium]